MVGDGGNDVGALAEADVGLALQVGGSSSSKIQPARVDFFDDRAMMQRFQQIQASRLREKQAQIQKVSLEQSRFLTQEIERRKSTGNRLPFGEMLKLIRQAQKKAAEAGARAERDSAGQSGEASAVAPFTAKSLFAAPELVRQGQCTSCSMVMQTQHLVLGTIIGMWRYAALSLEGARLSERQMLMSNMSLSIAFLGFIGARATRQTSTTAPPRTLFEPALLVSTLLQALVHIFVLRYAVHLAKETMGAAALAELLEFQKKAREQPVSLFSASSFFSRPFMPNLLNSIVFCVELAQEVAVLLVNYKGRPWMSGPLENLPLLGAAGAALTLSWACAVGWPAGLASALQLRALPSELRQKVVALLFISLMGTWAIDRGVEWVLNPSRSRARREAPLVVAATAVKGLPWLLWVWLVLTGNLLCWLIAWQLWRLLRAPKAAQPVQGAPPASVV